MEIYAPPRPETSHPRARRQPTQKSTKPTHRGQPATCAASDTSGQALGTFWAYWPTYSRTFKPICTAPTANPESGRPRREAKPRPRANGGALTTPGAALAFLRHADCPALLLWVTDPRNFRIQTERPLRRGGWVAAQQSPVRARLKLAEPRGESQARHQPWGTP
jgi:hypothetical protein